MNLNLIKTALLTTTVLILSLNSFASDRPMKKAMMGRGMVNACPYSDSENVQMDITDNADGVTIRYFAKEKKDIDRLQKIAKINKLTQELDQAPEIIKK